MHYRYHKSLFRRDFMWSISSKPFVVKLWYFSLNWISDQVDVCRHAVYPISTKTRKLTGLLQSCSCERHVINVDNNLLISLIMSLMFLIMLLMSLTVADPRFPRGAPTPEVSVPTYYFTNFLPKTAWIWKNFA